MLLILYLLMKTETGFVLKNQERPQQLVNIIVIMMKLPPMKMAHVEYVNIKIEKKQETEKLIK